MLAVEREPLADGGAVREKMVQVLLGDRPGGAGGEQAFHGRHVTDDGEEHLARGGVGIDRGLAGHGDEGPQALDERGVEAAHAHELADAPEGRVRREVGRSLPEVPVALRAGRARRVVSVRPVGQRIEQAVVEDEDPEERRYGIGQLVQVEPSGLVLHADLHPARAERLPPRVPAGAERVGLGGRPLAENHGRRGDARAGQRVGLEGGERVPREMLVEHARRREAGGEHGQHRQCRHRRHQGDAALSSPVHG